MRKLPALLVLSILVLTATAGAADAKGGRTSAADCKAGSSDPDCPDEPDTDAKGKPGGQASLGTALPFRVAGADRAAHAADARPHPTSAQS